MTLLSGLTNAISSIPVPKKVQQAFLETSKEGPNAILPLEGSVIVGRSAAAAKRGGFMEFQERLIEEIVVAVVWLWGVQWMRGAFDKLMPKLFPRLFKNSEHLSPEIAWKGLGKAKHVDLHAQEMFTKGASEVTRLLRLKGLRWLFSVGSTMLTVALIIPWLNQKKTEWIIRREEAKAAKEKAAQPAPVPAPVSSARRSSTEPARPPVSPAAPLTNVPYPAPVQPWGPAPVTETSVYPFAPQAPLWVPHPQPIWPQGAYGVPMFQGQAPNQNRVANASGQGPGAPKFGGMGFLQALGHAVEQTPYGSILVVDAGITGGRGVVASKRSVFETVEVVFRDAVSLYFYILFAPQVMKGIAKLIDPITGTSLRIEPKVVEALHNEMWRRIEANPALAANLQKEVPIDVMRRVLLGAPDAALGNTEGLLRDRLRMASMNQGFMPLVEKEAAAYLGNAQQGRAVAAEIRGFLVKRLADGGRLATDDLVALLDAIHEGQGAFGKLAPAERQNLGIAAKQAFRHSAGVTLDDLSEKAIRRMEIFKAIFDDPKLPDAEKQALMGRIRKMARHDALDQANTMLRRSLNLARGVVTDNGLIARLDVQADWIDKAVNSRLSLDDLLARELADLKPLLEKQGLTGSAKQAAASLEAATAAQLREIEAELAKLPGRQAQKALKRVQTLSTLVGQADGVLADAVRTNLRGTLADLKKAVAGSEAIRDLVGHYAEQADDLLFKAKGRLFSLFINPHDRGVTDKILELTRGGLQNDSRFIREAQDVLGQLVTDSRKYADPSKAVELRSMIAEYVEKMLGHAERKAAEAAQAEAGGVLKLLEPKALIEKFYKLNRNTHYLARLVAIGGAMFCLGVLVPKMQYALTKRLTGKDEHPGIAKVSGGNHGTNAAEAKSSAPTASHSVSAGASALNRNNFHAFKQRVS